LVTFYKAILSKLKEKADKVYSQFRAGDSASNAILLTRKPERGDDELSLFAGQTRVIPSKLLSNRYQKGTHSQSNSPSPSAQSGSEGDSTYTSTEQTSDVHPALMEYLSMLPVSNSSTTAYPTDFDYHHDIAVLPNFQELPHTTTQENLVMQFPWQPPPSSIPASIPSASTSSPNYPPTQRSSDTVSFMVFDPQSEFGTAASKSDFDEGDLFDLGMMITSDTGMDEQWTSFMRETGLLDGNLIGSGLYGVGETIVHAT
jgi:hypothetical protein